MVDLAPTQHVIPRRGWLPTAVSFAVFKKRNVEEGKQSVRRAFEARSGANDAIHASDAVVVHQRGSKPGRLQPLQRAAFHLLADVIVGAQNHPDLAILSATFPHLAKIVAFPLVGAS